MQPSEWISLAGIALGALGGFGGFLAAVGSWAVRSAIENKVLEVKLQLRNFEHELLMRVEGKYAELETKFNDRFTALEKKYEFIHRVLEEIQESQKKRNGCHYPKGECENREIQ